MPFPVSPSKRVSIDAHWPRDAILDDIRLQLPDLGAIAIERADGSLSFDVSWMTRYGPLFIVTSGMITVDSDEEIGRKKWLHYTLSFRRAALVTAIAAYGGLGIGVTLVEGSYPGSSLSGTLLFCTLAYGWLFGVWYLIVPSWFERRLRLVRWKEPPESSAV